MSASTMPSGTVVQASGIAKTYSEGPIRTEVLRKIDFSVARAETVISWKLDGCATQLGDQLILQSCSPDFVAP